MTKRFVMTGIVLAAGCSRNLGTPDAPERFARDTHNQYDRLVAKVNEDSSLSDEEKEREIARIEKERAAFDKYNQQGR